jgi:type II secretory pathway pseudopilin PulG
MIVAHKKAFSMITAIFVIIIMASVGILVMNVTSKTIKETTQQYRKEQAVLLAKSYTEFAIMAVTANDRPNGCIENISGNDILADADSGKGYLVDANISYIGKDSTANLVGNCSAGSILDSNVDTNGSDLQIIVDVYVKYKELDNPNADWITYHRRTLQKI